MRTLHTTRQLLHTVLRTEENRMDKTDYEIVEIDVITFDGEDVIATSCVPDDCPLNGDIG